MPKCVNVGKLKFIVMNRFSKFSFLAIAIALVAYLFSCTGEELPSFSDETVEQRTLLFKRITVTTDGNGDYSFLEEKSRLQPVVEKLFTQKNQLLRKVDDFGLGKDDYGKPYFYVKEVTDEKSKTIFIYLKNENTISTRGDGSGDFIPGIECENEKCCDECVVNNDKCTCHDQNAECQKNGETKFSCKESSVALLISLP